MPQPEHPIGPSVLDSEGKLAHMSEPDGKLSPFNDSPEPEAEITGTDRTVGAYSLLEDLSIARQLRNGRTRVSSVIIPGRSTNSIRLRIRWLRMGKLRIHPMLSKKAKATIAEILDVILLDPRLEHVIHPHNKNYKFEELVTIFDCINESEDPQTLEGIVDLLPHRSPVSVLRRLDKLLRVGVQLHPDFTPIQKRHVEVLRAKQPSTDVLEALVGNPPRARDGVRFTEQDDETIWQTFWKKSVSLTESCFKLERNPVNIFNRFEKLKREEPVEIVDDLGDGLDPDIEFDEAVEDEDPGAEIELTQTTFKYWSSQETDRLVRLRRDGLEWQKVADILARTASSCQNQYYKHLKALKTSTAGNGEESDENNEAGPRTAPKTPNVTTRKVWSPDEIDKLLKLRGKGKPWKVIAERLGRTYRSCVACWSHYRITDPAQSSDLPCQQVDNEPSIMINDNQAEGFGAIAASASHGEGGASTDAMDVDVGRLDGTAVGPSSDNDTMDEIIDLDGEPYSLAVQTDDRNLEPHPDVQPDHSRRWGLEWILN